MPTHAFHPPRFSDFTDAYTGVLDQVHLHPHHSTAARGVRSRERLNMAFTLDNPRRRIPAFAARRFNPVFCWAEVLWYLLGRDDLEMIGYYAPRLKELSADQSTLTGTAYGPRVFGRDGAGNASAWKHAVDAIRHDPDTKRAVVPLLRPEEIADPHDPDVACTIALQFVQRRDLLHTVATMRANDAVIGLACDVHAFTVLAEFTAIQLGLNLGTYTHQVASMHVNETDRMRVERILADTAHDYTPLVMPADTTWDTIAEVAAWEMDLRLDEKRLTPGADLGLHPYWAQVVWLFELYRQVVYEPTTWMRAPAELSPIYRWLLMQRWPERFEEARR